MVKGNSQVKTCELPFALRVITCELSNSGRHISNERQLTERPYTPFTTRFEVQLPLQILLGTADIIEPKDLIEKFLDEVF
jgi:hypothetical protein